MTLDPRLLRPFVALAEELHFGRAAQRLNVTQPALSQQIARLERQLGVRLFDRTRTNVELSDAGAAMLAAARTAVDAAVAADEVARAHAQGEVGELRLGLSPGAHYLVQPLLAEFARRRPRLRVQARQDSSSVLAEQVAARQLELALGFCAEPVDGVVCEPLREEPVVIAVARERWISGRGAASLAELSAETFALVDAHDGAGYNRAVEALCRAAGFEPRTPADPLGPMAWETAVRAQGCVGLTTRSAASSTARGIRLVDLIPTATFRLDLVEQGGPPAVRRPAARAFADLMRARLARDVWARSRTAGRPTGRPAVVHINRSRSARRSGRSRTTSCGRARPGTAARRRC